MRVQYWWSCAYLVVCVLVGSVVGQYHAMRPVAQERGLEPGFLLAESFTRFDVGHASVGLAVGVASLVVGWWVRRGR